MSSRTTTIAVRMMKYLAAALCILLVAAPVAVQGVEEISEEKDLEHFLADQGKDKLIVVCTVPPGPKWDEEREMVEIAEAFFLERCARGELGLGHLQSHARSACVFDQELREGSEAFFDSSV